MDERKQLKIFSLVIRSERTLNRHYPRDDNTNVITTGSSLSGAENTRQRKILPNKKPKSYSWTIKAQHSFLCCARENPSFRVLVLLSKLILCRLFGFTTRREFCRLCFYRKSSNSNEQTEVKRVEKTLRS